MTSEEIIERLLSENHITVKEAIILIKDLVKNRYFDTSDPLNINPDKSTFRLDDVVLCYGCQTQPFTAQTGIESMTDSKLK